MPLLQARAYGFAATFRLKDLTKVVEGAEIHQDQDRDRLLATFPGEDKDIPRVAIFYDFGALVFFGMPESEQERLVKDLSTYLSPAEPHAPLTEDLIIEVRTPSTQSNGAIEVQFDRVIVPAVTIPILDIVGLLLAQSVSMDYYEEDVQEILQRTEAINLAVQTHGRIPGKTTNLTKFIGSCIVTKNAVISALALFDKPDAAWEDRDLDRLYNALRLELEIDDRFRALEAKLRMLQENLVLLVDLSHTKRSRFMEAVIVALILLEVVLMCWQIFTGRGH